MTPVRLAILGAGMIGKRHIEHVTRVAEAELLAVIDPSPVGEDLARAHGVKWFRSFAEMMRADRPDGVIIATPNQLHVENGLEAVEAGVPALVEKPIANSVMAASRLVEAAERTRALLLTGHHRRHNPMIRKAKEIIDSSRLGTIRSVHGTCWFYKPEDYFDVPWRREKGGGPVFLNLIHDVDNLRFLCGEVASVQAYESNLFRGHTVEDTAVIILRFRSGALGTLNVSDAIVAPWSWELTTGENPTYPRTDEACYLFGGTQGSLTVPQLDVWHNKGRRSWWEPIDRERIPVQAEDPLALQIRQFCHFVRGVEPPLVSGREGLETLKVIEAIKESAATGTSVEVS
jgi:predicted dehydrogenase